MSGLFDLTGRVALVTGGNGGIGLGMAKAIHGAGASVMIAGRNTEKNAAAVAALGERAASVVADVNDAASVAAMVKATTDRFGGLDILVINAGMNIRKPVQELAFDEWRQVIATNLDSAFTCAKAAYPALKPAGRWGVPDDLGGIAVFLASSASDFVTGTAIPVDGGYAAMI